jgi:hypothetical protein
MLGLLLGFVHPLGGHANPPRSAKVTVYGAQVAATMPVESALARQIGRPDSMDELVRRLLVAVRALSRYDAEVEFPRVHILPLAEIHQRLCGGPCAIRAAYVPGEGLYIEETMRPLSNPYDQSILFHEVVHHVQVATASHPARDECHRWREREIEAYALQNRFLFALGAPSRVFDPGVPCGSPGAAGAQTFDAR